MSIVRCIRFFTYLLTPEDSSALGGEASRNGVAGQIKNLFWFAAAICLALGLAQLH